MTKNRYTLVGINFDAMNEKKGFNFDELVFNNIKESESIFDGDVLKFWDGLGWGHQFFYNGEAWESSEEESFDEVYENGIPTGSAFFYLSREKDSAADPVSVSFAGAVSATGKTLIAPKNRLTLISNPYPSNFDVDKDVTFTNVLEGESIFDGDVLKFWDGLGWGHQFFFNGES